MRNTCQNCLLDLEFGLPLDVRDKIITEGEANNLSIPKELINRYFWGHEITKDVSIK